MNILLMIDRIFLKSFLWDLEITKNLTYYKRNEETWTSKELSTCQLAYNGAIEFILKTDKPIYSFTNCHNSKDFPKALTELLKDGEK